MRTITKELFTFDELSEEAKEKAVNSARAKDWASEDVRYFYQEARQTVDKFHGLNLGTKLGNRSWLEVNFDYVSDNILNLKGLRLRTWVINNLPLWKGKYYSLWSKTEVSHKHHKEGYPVLKSRYSKVFADTSCVLTGVCWDDSFLQPIHDFIAWKNAKAYESMDFETLVSDCFHSLAKDLQSNEEYSNSDEAIIDSIKANGIEFDIEGNIY